MKIRKKKGFFKRNGENLAFQYLTFLSKNCKTVVLKQNANISSIQIKLIENHDY